MATSVLSLVVDTSKFLPAMRQANMALTAMSSKALQVGAGLATISIPAALFARKAVKSLIEFDSAMTNSLSIMTGVTDKMRSDMEALSTSLSTQLPISATESAKAFEYLGLAGLSAEQSLAALPTVAKFATAGNFEMSKATDQLTDALSALGLASKDPQKYMTNMGILADKLTKASTSANASISQFSESLTNEAALTMRTYNIELSDGIALLGVYADQGIKGLEAGSLFSRGVRLMLNAASENSAAWTKMGISVKTAEGELLPFSQIAKNLEKLLGNMSTAEKSATLTTLGFQARIQQAIFPLVGMSDRLDELKGKIKGAAGTLNEITNKQLKSMSNQLKIATNIINNFARSIAATFEPEIRFVTKSVQKMFRLFQDLNPGIKKLIGYFTAFAASLAPIAFLVAGISAIFGTLISSFLSIAGAITAAGGFAAAITAIGAAVTAALPVILPIVGAIALISAETVALAVVVYDNWEMIKSAIMIAVDSIFPSINGLSDSFSGLKETMASVWEFTKKYVSPMLGKTLVAGIETLTIGVLLLRAAFNVWSISARSAIWLITRPLKALAEVWTAILMQFDSTKNAAIEINKAISDIDFSLEEGITEDAKDIGASFAGIGKSILKTSELMSGKLSPTAIKAAEDAKKAAEESSKALTATPAADTGAMTKMQESKFAGLAVAGSVEAYKAEISRVGYDDKIAKSTSDTAKNTAEIARTLSRQREFAIGRV